MDGRGWFKESARHSLASRGIRTRAIINPISSPRWGEGRYTPGSYKGMREYLGSGLENLDEDEIVHWVSDANEIVNQILNENNVHLGLEVESIYLVGSRVSGFYKSGSDLDIMVKYKEIPLNQKVKYSNDIENAHIEMLSVINDPAWWLGDPDPDYIEVDVWWGWDLPEKNLPHLKIWEAS